MAKPSRFTFSLLRLMLSIAAMAVILAIGRWIDAPLTPILVAAATAGLIAFVIRSRQVYVVFLEGVCALLGVFVALFLSPAVRPPRDEYSDLTYAVVGAFLGWFIGCCCAPSEFRTEADRGIHGTEPPTDEIEVRPLDDAGRALEDVD